MSHTTINLHVVGRDEWVGGREGGKGGGGDRKEIKEGKEGGKEIKGGGKERENNVTIYT